MASTTQPDYFNKYENLSFQRDENGILEVKMHTNGDSLVFTGKTHREFPDAFYDISRDRDNRVVILTGLGSSRGRYFLLTQEKLTAQQAHQLGVVNEVLPSHKLLDRAWELAKQLAKQPTLNLRYTRVALTQRIKRLVSEGIGYGLALEGITATDLRGSRKT